MNSYVLRDIQWDLEQLLANRRTTNNVILIEGPRQVGKTTLVRETLKALQQIYVEFNLERQPEIAHKIDACDNFQAFTQLVETVLAFPLDGTKVLFIDEAQESAQLGQFVRFMKEEWRDTLVILSGSSMSRIFRNARYPVGRVTPLHVQPFSFKEFLRASHHAPLVQKFMEAKSVDSVSAWSHEIHQLLISVLEQYLEVGGLPEIVTEYFSRGSWGDLRDNLLYGYYQEFRRVHGESAQIYLTAVLKTTTHLLGMPFKNSHVAKLLDGGKNQKIVEAISQLEAWQMIRTVEQRGPAVEQHFHPKRYLFDIGIARQLRESALPAISLLNTTGVGPRQSIGGVIESVVANSLLRTHRDLSGWKKASSGSEVDFVIKYNNHIVPIECKAALNIKNSHTYGVQDFLRLHKERIGVIVGLAPFGVRELATDLQLVILPVYLMEYLSDILQQVMSKEGP